MSEKHVVLAKRNDFSCFANVLIPQVLGELSVRSLKVICFSDKIPVHTLMCYQFTYLRATCFSVLSCRIGAILIRDNNFHNTSKPFTVSLLAYCRMLTSSSWWFRHSDFCFGKLKLLLGLIPVLLSYLRPMGRKGMWLIYS